MTEYIIDWDTSLVIDTFSKNNLRKKIVRCRDCKFYDTDWESEAHPGRWWCDESWHYREPDGFCKWGERRGA